MSKQETIEDIIYEMRDAAHRSKNAIDDDNHLCSDWYYDAEVQGWLTVYAERIKAAWKRETDKHTDYLDDPDVLDKMRFIVSEYVLCNEIILTESAKRLRETARSTVISLYNTIRDYEQREAKKNAK